MRREHFVSHERPCYIETSHIQKVAINIMAVNSFSLNCTNNQRRIIVMLKAGQIVLYRGNGSELYPADEESETRLRKLKECECNRLNVKSYLFCKCHN